MNKDSGRVAKNSSLYSLVQMFIKGIGLIMLPLYTNVTYIGTDEYGEYSLLSQFIYIAVFLVSLSLNNAAIRFYSDFKHDEEKVKSFFGTIITFNILTGVGFILLCLILQKPLVNIFFTGIDFFPNVALTLLTTVAYSIYQIYQAFLQSMQDGVRFARNGSLFVLTHAVLNVVFLVGFKGMSIGSYKIDRLNGLVLSLILTYYAFAIFGIFDLLRRKKMKICLQKDMLTMALKYSIPLLPHSMANNMAGLIPKVFLNKVDKVQSAAFTAIHSVGMQFSSVIDVVQNAINSAQRPWFNEKMHEGEKGKEEIIDFVMLSTLVTEIVCLGAGLFAQEVTLFIARNDAYYEAWKIVPIFAMVHSIKCIYYNHTLAVMYDVKTNNKMFLCSGMGTLCNFLLTGILAWWVFDFNIWGTAISFLISRTVMAVLVTKLCRKSKIIMFPLKEMINKVLLCGIGIAAGIIPINAYRIISTSEQIKLFSSWSFINFGYKLIIFVIFTLLIIGNRRTEIVDFVKDLTLRKKKKGKAVKD